MTDGDVELDFRHMVNEVAMTWEEHVVKSVLPSVFKVENEADGDSVAQMFGWSENVCLVV